MSPEAALTMIRNGVNPMDTDINELSEYLTSISAGNSADERFSAFLYKLDRTDGITQEERRQFIGIFKMMNIFTKDAGQAAGALVRQGAELTMSNLMAAYNSRKLSVDRTIDESFGMSETQGTVNYYNTLFSSHASKITPAVLKDVNDEQDIDERTAEDFIDAVDENYSISREAEYYEEYLADVSDAAGADEQVLRELERFDIQHSIGNIAAMQQIMSEGWGAAAGTYAGISNTAQNDAGDMNSRTPEEQAAGLLDVLGDEEAETKTIDSIEAAADAELAQAVDTAENYDSFNAARMRCRRIGLITQMARKHEYLVPFDNDGTMGTMRIQLVHDTQNAGRLSVETNIKSIGKVSVKASVTSVSISVFAVTDGDEEALKNVMADVAANHDNMTYNVTKSTEYRTAGLAADGDAVPTRQLYDFAKELVGSLLNSDKRG